MEVLLIMKEEGAGEQQRSSCRYVDKNDSDEEEATKPSSNKRSMEDNEEESDGNYGGIYLCEEEEDSGENGVGGGVGLTEDHVLDNLAGVVMDGVVEESDDEVVAQVAKKHKVDGMSTSSRSPQFTASQVVEGLDGYYKHINDPENKRKWIATKKEYTRVC